MRRGCKIQKKRTHREIERERETRPNEKGPRQQGSKGLARSCAGRREERTQPVPSSQAILWIRNTRSVGRTAAVHAARFVQSSQTRPSYWLCIRPPASSGISLWTSRWCRSMMLTCTAHIRACDTQRSPLLCGKLQTVRCYCFHNCFTVKWQWDSTITVINSVKMSICTEWSTSVIVIEE